MARFLPGLIPAALVLLTPTLLSAQTRVAEPIATSAKLKTDERIAAYSKAVAAQPSSSHLQNLLALTYIQKMRETVDFSYLDRASTLVESVLVRDPGNYESLRLRSEIDMERHEFARAADYSQEMAHFAPDDPANWGTLGDSSMELGRYQAAGEAYSRMLALQSRSRQLQPHRLVSVRPRPRGSVHRHDEERHRRRQSRCGKCCLVLE